MEGEQIDLLGGLGADNTAFGVDWDGERGKDWGHIRDSEQVEYVGLIVCQQTFVVGQLKACQRLRNVRAHASSRISNSVYSAAALDSE